MSDNLFDFGFTAVDETELQSYQQAEKKVEETTEIAKTTQDKIDKLYNSIQPLLNNLKKNPEKEYILWPNRLEKVEAFETHLQNIYKS
jgi:peptidoglycan hydrolase CwlO-like protein